MDRRQGRAPWPFLGTALAAALVAGACQGVGEWLAGGAPTVVTATPAHLSPTAFPPLVSALLHEGRPYLVEEMAPAVVHYEPWIDYAIIQLVKETFAVTQEVQQEELGVWALPPIELHITWESPFNRSAGQNQFQQPSWLAGFATYNLQGGRATDAKVYINAQAKGLVHNTAHELTHIATPALPQWLGEGVAEYVGVRVDRVMTPEDGELRMLQARAKVRQAIREGNLLTPEELQGFPWESPPRYTTLELAYAEGWQVVEYLATTYGVETLSGLVAGYAAATEESLAPFEAVIGKPAGELFTAFAQQALVNLTPEEQTGESLCQLSDKAAEEAKVTEEWNRFLTQSSGQDPNRFVDSFRQFAQQWSALAAQTEGTPAPGEAGPVGDAIVSYIRSMHQAMEQFIQGRATTANRSLLEGNQGRIAAQGELHQTLEKRAAWLTCPG